jgi:hypothetical protein
MVGGITSSSPAAECGEKSKEAIVIIPEKIDG